MKIGYLVSEYPAVSHTFIRREVAALRRRGFDIGTFSVRKPGRIDWMSSEDLAEYHATKYLLPPRVAALVKAHLVACLKRPGRYFDTLRRALWHRPPGVRGSTYAVIYFAEAILLADELTRRDITHLHNHFANAAGTVGLLATRYLGISWSFTVHGISEFDYPAGLLLGEKIKAADFVACVSHFGQAQAQRCVESSEWHKFFINRCGVDVSTLPTGGTRRQSEVLRILSVGRLSREKAIPGLLSAFAAVIQRGIRARLDIVGDGPERAAIEQCIMQLKLGDRCTLLGQKSGPDALKEIAESDIFVMSSLMEGLPVVLMEAMALQVPVVAPCVAGIPELVEHERTGLTYVVSDWNDLANCLERLAGDRELRERLGSAGYQRIMGLYAIERAVVPIAGRFEGLDQ